MDTAKDSKFTTNTFENGLWLDAQTSVQPEGTVPFALNIINRDEYQNSFRSNEHGTTHLTGIPGVIGDVYIKDKDWSVFITKTGGIVLYDYNKPKDTAVKQVATFAEFKCTMKVRDCEYLNVQYAG